MLETRAIPDNWLKLSWHKWHKTWILLSLGVAAGAIGLGCGGSSQSSGDTGTDGSSTTDGSTADGSTTDSSTSTTTTSGSSAGGSGTTGSTDTTGSSSDGSSTTRGAGGAASGSSTTTGGIGGEPICCNALPTCPSGFVEVGPTGCPNDVECTTVELCCDSVTCMPDEISCDAYPGCAQGDIEVNECPADASCYTESLCGNTILCQEAECFPDEEPNKEYVGLGDVCLLIDFYCSGETTYFYDECGCGCEQDESCPEFVNCEPGGDLDPLCSDTETCPFTERAE